MQYAGICFFFASSAPPPGPFLVFFSLWGLCVVGRDIHSSWELLGLALLGDF